MQHQLLFNAILSSGINSNKAILVTAFSRPELLRKNLHSVRNAVRSTEYTKIVVWQTNASNASDMQVVLDENSDLIDVLICIDGQSRSPLQNINFNCILGMNLAFDLLGCDWVVSIEEDIQIGYDTLVFAEEMTRRYARNRAFRAVNFGSIEPFSESLKFTYSLLRYGPHQQGMLFTRKLWKRYTLKEYLRRCETEPFDSLFGTFMKTGFVVTPNSSRSLDEGRGGTHTVGGDLDHYFEGQAQSWVGSAPFFIEEYLRVDMEHQWRIDALIYRKRQDLVFDIKHAVFNFDKFVFKGYFLRARTKDKLI